MLRTALLVFCAALLPLAATMPTVQADPLEPVAAETTLDVTVRYRGPGQVSDARKMWIWLFDREPDHTAAVTPIAMQSVAVNGGVASFTGIGASRVWVAVMYDERGGFAADGPPPSGSPAGSYMVDGQTAPVTPGPNASIQLTFNDQFRIP